MGKILIFASIAISLAAAGLGFVNKNNLDTTKKELDTTKGTLKTTSESLATTKGDLKTTSESLATTTAEKSALESQVTGLKTAAETAKSETAKITTEKAALDTQVTQLTTDLAAAKEELTKIQAAGGATPAANPDADREAKAQEQQTIITQLQSELDAARSKVEAFQKANNDRVAKVGRKGLEGRVLAVNPAWNFVVLNLGDKNGVVNNTEMLVKRGTQLLGKVRITSVEPSTSIADIVANSVPEGTAISPGDNVIYQIVEE